MSASHQVLDQTSTKTLEDRLRETINQHKIADLYVFGSRAPEIVGKVRGQAVPSEYPDSDVDIGVLPLPGQHLSVHEKVRLAIALEDLLEVDRADLVALPDADPFLATDIIRGHLLYCADAHAQAEYELYVLRRAGDLAPYARARWNHILRGDPL